MAEQVNNSQEIRVAVIGAGMAGKAHAAGYLTAPATYDSTLPKVRLVSMADANAELAESTAARFGFERFDTSWQAIAEADDIDWSALWWRTSCTVKLLRRCLHPASTCCVRSRCRTTSKMRRL